MQIFEEARLIDRHEGPEPHGHRRELPELRHQPRMRIGGEPVAGGFLAKVQKLLLAQSALNEGARVDARRRMSLDVDEVPAILFRWTAPDMAEADVVKRGGGVKARDMPAKLRRFLVRAQNDRDRIPANDGPDTMLDV